MPAGYSSTPLARKLGLKPGNRLVLVHAPASWSVEGLPQHVSVVRRRSPRADVLIAFFARLSDLEREVTVLSASIVPDGSLWLAWPRRAAGHVSDITDDGVRLAALPLGLVDVKVAALGDDWSGLKMVWRRERRASLRRSEG